MTSGISKGLLTSSACIFLCAISIAQDAQPKPAPPDPAAIAAASTAERNRELQLLGITQMQPGATAYDIGKPGNANYDESKANPYPKLPDVLTLNNGTKVTTPAQWKKRREEIIASFDENVYGKYPAHIPKVTWKVDSVESITVQGVPALVKHITGHVDNSAYPAITVDIHADIVTPPPRKAKRSRSSSEQPPFAPAPTSRGPQARQSTCSPCPPIHPTQPNSSSSTAGASLAATQTTSKPTTAQASTRASSDW